MRRPLYAITQDYMQAYDAMCDDEDLTEEAISDTLNGMGGEFDDKAIATAAIIKNMEADTEGLKDAEHNIYRRRCGLENRIDWLRNNLMSNMRTLGRNHIKHDEFEIKLRTNPESVLVMAEGVIPKEYYTVKYSKVLDKERIRNDLKLGHEIPGVSLVRKTSLSIK